MLKESLPIFVLNLEKDKKKRRYMETLFEKNNLSVEFIKGVVGTLLRYEEVKTAYSEELAISSIGRKLSLAEIGCALSHKKIYQGMVNQEEDVALILEDDVYFDEGLMDVLKTIGNFPLNWEVILLGHHGGASRGQVTKCSLWGWRRLNSRYNLKIPSDRVFGTYGYLISQRGARKLLSCTNELTMPIDHYTGDSRCVNLYVVTPTPVKIFDYLSDNYNSMEGRAQLQAEAEAVPLIDSASFSWYKKGAINMDIYIVLNKTLAFIKSLWKQVKPLKRYK